MTTTDDRSILGRNPITSLVMIAIISGLAGIALLFTAVFAIVGIPLLAISIVVAAVAVYQYRKRSPDESATIPEADRRRA